MKVRHSTALLPRFWRGLQGAKSALLICTIYALDSSRLGLKLLVFPTAVELRAFWKANLGSNLGPRCLGAVNAMGCTSTRFYKDGRESSCLVVDPRYYAVMGLSRRDISAEVVAHEAMHAAFAYVRRVKHRNLWNELGRDNEEELYCYPAGKITAAVLRELRREKLLGF